MNFQKLHLKWKILEHFTSPKQRSARRKLLSPPSDKSFLRLWDKSFRTEIYSNIQIFAFQVLRECSYWTSRNGTIQFFFWHQPESCFWLFCGSKHFIMLSELRFVKWVRLLERNCIIKWVICFASFCWLWDFLPENLKLLDKLQTWGFQ